MPTKSKAAEGKEPNKKEEHRPMLEAVRRLMLASIGAAAIAQEEMEDLVDKLVERGEIAKKDGEKLMREVMDKRKERTSKVEDRINKRIEGILERMSVPTRADIDSLGEKIASLSKKVDDLKKNQG